LTGTEPSNAATALAMTGIGKSFPGVRALDDVTFEVLPGEVHALVGENGAGKSTLMAVASGALAPDEGVVEIDGQRLDRASPDDARALGLAIVRQDPALLPDLTVAENMAIGVGYRRVGGIVNAPKWAQEQLDPWGMGIDARSRVDELSVEQRFIVEIQKALALEPKVLILDEPTEHLNAEEVQRLFRRVRAATATGAAVVYISHRIPEVKQIADRITVLRDGRIRGTFPADSVTEDQIIERVIGRTLDAVFPPKPGVAENAPEVLVVDGLSGAGFQDINLRVRAGEIVGLAGVQGNGQTELIRALAGLQPTRGTLEVDGRALRGGAPGYAKAGVVYVPADRAGEGVMLPLSVAENIVQRTLRKVSSLGFVNERRVQTTARERIASLSVKTPSPRTPISSLSGGNQQKAVMARTMLSEPKVLLAEEPTQGVDAGARVDIYKIIRDVADSGAGIVLLSSDSVELQGLCDRVLVMSRGNVVDELVGDEITESAIATAALTTHTSVVRTQGANSRSAGFGRWLRGDYSPAVVLAAIFVVLGTIATFMNPSYLGDFNLSKMLFAIAPLLLFGAAQQVVVMGGGFDLSVGPLMGFLVVISSFWIVEGGNLVVGLLLMLIAALGVGLINGVLVTRFRVNAVVATLAMFMALQGAYLLLRSTPGGTIYQPVARAIKASIGFVPIVTIIAVLVLVGLELALRYTKWGLSLRAVGSRMPAAERLGIRVNRARFWSYVLCSLLIMPASVIMMAQIGIGDGRPSLPFTLTSVMIVVLAGASVFGGRGSFIAIMAAAFLVQQIDTTRSFFGLPQAWQYLLPGLITVGAAALYATLRRTRSRRVR